MSKAPSLKDVAKLASVGLGTASRVLNNSGPVADEKRQAVLDAMKKLNYKPNAIARSLKSKRTKTIGVMIPDITNPFYPEIIRGIEDIAAMYDYTIFLLDTDMTIEREQQCLSVLQEKMVDGIIFMSFTVSEEVMRNLQDIPLILISTIPKHNEFVTITINNEKAAYSAVDYLCKLGHRKIVMLSGPFDDDNAGIPRLMGYKKALKDNDIEFMEENVVEGDYNFKEGYRCMKEVLEKEELPTAVFAQSDNMAIGAIKAIMEKGLKVPEDISIIGFDGLPSSEYVYPGITTIAQPIYEMGAVGMEALVKLINKETTENSVELDFKLIERNSCRKL